MNRQKHILPRPASMLLALGLGLASASAFAAGGHPANSAEAQYQQDMAACKSGHTQESKATCEREAGAALQAARHGQLVSDNTETYKQDATRRCMNLPAGQRQDCITLMNDPDARTQGSVNGGGIIRETTITIPG